MRKLGKKIYRIKTYILSDILFSKYSFHSLVYIFLYKKTSRGFLEDQYFNSRKTSYSVKNVKNEEKFVLGDVFIFFLKNNRCV